MASRGVRVEEGPAGLASIIQQGVTLSADFTAMLQAEMEKGIKFFDSLNESRLKLAFASFDDDMRKALFEVLFLLHVNDPKLTNWKYTGFKFVQKNGIRRQKEYQATADLYIEGAPHGLPGIDRLASYQ